MTDAGGQEVKVGDVILFPTMGSTHLHLGYVEKTTPKGVRVIYIEKAGPHRNVRTAVKPKEAFAKVADVTTPEVKAFLVDIVKHQLDKHLT